jgi:hypothetical protein
MDKKPKQFRLTERTIEALAFVQHMMYQELVQRGGKNPPRSLPSWDTVLYRLAMEFQKRHPSILTGDEADDEE